MLQVESDAFFVAVEALEVDAVLGGGIGRHIAGHIAPGGRVFDFDNFGAQIRQHHRRPGAGTELFYGQNAYALEGEVLLVCRHVLLRWVSR